MSNPGQGIEYEVHIPAYFALKLNRDKDIDNFSLQSNLPCFGNLDDVFLDIKTKDGHKHYFAFQLKHKDPQKHKRLLPTNFTAKGDFNLAKYRDSYANLSKRKQRYNFILYSNIDFDDNKKKEVKEFEMVNAQHTNHVLDASFFDQSANHTGIYKFRVQNGGDHSFKKFFRQFTLLVCQQDARSVANCIISFFSHEYGAGENVAVNYINLFRKWHKGEYTNKKLDKKTLNLHLCDLLLSPFIITIPLIDRNEKLEILEESTERFDLNIVEDSKNNFTDELNRNNIAQNLIIPSHVTKKIKTTKRFIVNNSKDPGQAMNQCLLYLGKNMKIVDKFAKTLSNQETTKILNFAFNVPFTVEFNELSKLLIYKLTQSCRQLKLVIVGSNVPLTRFRQMKIFSNLEDLLRVDQNLYSQLATKCKISIQNRPEMALEELMQLDPDFSKAIGVMQLYQMTRQTLSVDEKAEDLPKTYIPRTLSIVHLAAENVLEHIFHSNDLLIINCNHTFDLIKDQISIKGLNTTEINQFDDSHYREIIVCENEACSKTQFDEICAKTLRSVHLVELVDEKSFLLIISTRTNELRDLRLEEKSVPEDDIHASFEYPINFVCAQPGMGKSTLFRYLRTKCPSRFWTVSVDLKQHSKFFEEKPSPVQVLDRFLGDDANLFCDKLKKVFVEKKMVCFFFDGLDELQYSSVDNVLDLANKLTSIGYRVWLSSRENLLKQIEDKLNVFPIRINDLTRTEQERYIRNRLRIDYNEAEIAVIIQKIFTSSNVVNNSRILGVPLQLFILTQIFLEDRHQYEHLHEDIFLITKMYQIYFEGRWQHFLKKLECQCPHLLSGFLRSKLDQYEIPALRSCLGKDLLAMQINLPQTSTFLEDIKRKGDELGIITKFDDAGNPVFDHETYAEFFACKWLSKNLEKVRRAKTFLFSMKYENLRLILDILLAEDSPLHLAVIYKDMGQFARHLSDDVAKDKGGRTPLHLACSHGVRHSDLKPNKCWYRYDNDDIDLEELEVSRKIITQLLRKKGDGGERDELFAWDAFDYAVATQCLIAIEIILQEHLVIGSLYVELGRNDFLEILEEIGAKLMKIYDTNTEIITMVYYSAKFGYENILNVILDTKTSFHVMTSDTLSLSLHLAVQGNQCNIVNRLLLEKPQIDAINYNNETPLHIATKADNLQMIKILLDHGAPATASILKYASNPVTFNLLQNKGADINYVSHDEMNLLHLVAEDGNLATIDLLLEKGLAINATDVNGNTPLHLAVKSGHYHITKKLLENGANLHATTRKTQTALHYVAIQGNREIAQLLMDGNININAQDKNGATALHLAAEFRRVEIISLLLQNNALPDIVTNFGETALHYAAIGGNVNVISLLLLERINVNATNWQSKSALHLAAENRHYSATKLLVENGACVHDIVHKQRTSLHYAAKGGNVEIAKLLLVKGVQLNSQDGDGTSALHLAVKFKHFPVTKLLIENGADVNAHNELGETPLHLAIKCRCFQAFHFLLKKGADVNVKTINSETPLHYAAREGLMELVTVLLENNADINAVNKYGKSPLHLAIEDGYSCVTKLLIDKGANVNIVTEKLETTLHYAAARGHLEIMQMLLQKQVPVNTINIDGATALHLSAQRGNLEITKRLLGKGMSAEVITKKNETALHYAVRGGNVDVVAFLVKKHVPVNFKNEEGVTALHLALECGRYDIVQQLILAGADIGAVTKNKETVMHFVARGRGKNCRLLDLMIEKGAQTNAKDSNGITPLRVATQSGNSHIVNKLLELGVDDQDQVGVINENDVAPWSLLRYLRK